MVAFATFDGMFNVQMLNVPFVELDTHVEPVIKLIIVLSYLTWKYAFLLSPLTAPIEHLELIDNVLSFIPSLMIF